MAAQLAAARHLLVLDDPALFAHRPRRSRLGRDLLHLQLPQRSIAEETSRYSPDRSAAAGSATRVCVLLLLAANCPPALVDVSFGREDGRGDVRVAVLVSVRAPRSTPPWRLALQSFAASPSQGFLDHRELRSFHCGLRWYRYRRRYRRRRRLVRPVRHVRHVRPVRPVRPVRLCVPGGTRRHKVLDEAVLFGDDERLFHLAVVGTLPEVRYFRLLLVVLLVVLRLAALGLRIHMTSAGGRSSRIRSQKIRRISFLFFLSKQHERRLQGVFAWRRARGCAGRPRHRGEDRRSVGRQSHGVIRRGHGGTTRCFARSLLSSIHSPSTTWFVRRKRWRRR